MTIEVKINVPHPMKLMALLYKLIARYTSVVQHSIRINWKEGDVVPCCRTGIVICGCCHWRTEIEEGNIRDEMLARLYEIKITAVS